MQVPDNQDILEQPTTAQSATIIYVCVTCRAEGELADPRAGRRLHDALAEEFNADPAVEVVPVECLSVCRRPCTVSFAAPGKWTYVYGDLPAESSAPVIAEAARLYGAASDGLIAWKLRADAIKRGVVARVPPLRDFTDMSASLQQAADTANDRRAKALVSAGALPVTGQIS